MRPLTNSIRTTWILLSFDSHKRHTFLIAYYFRITSFLDRNHHFLQMVTSKIKVYIFSMHLYLVYQYYILLTRIYFEWIHFVWAKYTLLGIHIESLSIMHIRSINYVQLSKENASQTKDNYTYTQTKKKQHSANMHYYTWQFKYKCMYG